MSLHGTPRHVQLGGDFGVVATLQKQFDNLLFARPQPNSLILHQVPLFSFIVSRGPMSSTEAFQT